MFKRLLIIAFFLLALSTSAYAASNGHGREGGRAHASEVTVPDIELSMLASQFDGHEVTVYCDRHLGFYGMAEPQTNRLWLNGYFCGPLKLLHFGISVYPARQGVGLISLAHEATHLQGVNNEAQTECYAMQQTDDLARIFGAQEYYIPTLQHYAFADHNALVKVAPQYGNKKRCRANGSWDLSPNDGLWP